VILNAMANDYRSIGVVHHHYRGAVRSRGNCCEMMAIGCRIAVRHRDWMLSERVQAEDRSELPRR
jgi:hypothetical protein